MEALARLRLGVIEVLEGRPGAALDAMVGRKGAGEGLRGATAIHVAVKVALVVGRASGATDVALDEVAERVAVCLSLDAFGLG